MKGFKNLALSRVDGVITAHCIMCGKYIGNEYDTNYYALIKRKYCETHAKESKEYQMKFARREYKQRQKKNVKVMKELCDLYRKEVYLQQDYIARLKRELDDLKRNQG